MQDFMSSPKKFIARRGHPKQVYCDNGGTFLGVARWLKLAMRDEQINEFLVKNGITWHFNISRAPWWGGQFERLVGLMKHALHKTIGRGLLTWKELEEVLLDVEVALNGRPLRPHPHIYVFLAFLYCSVSKGVENNGPVT